MATYFPEGNYCTIDEVRIQFNVQRRTAQQWVDKGWLKSIYAGGAHHIEIGQLEGFSPPRPGRKAKVKE